MQAITEEMGVHKGWYEEARSKEMTLETLPAFLKKLTEEYGHDYGTICHAVAAGALATAHAIDRSPQGGITGFQSGAIMWEFIKHWQFHLQDQPLKLLQFENMLYPQYRDKFTTISKGTWEWLQKKANERLNDPNFATAHPNVRAHIESIRDGAVPFDFRIEGE